MANNVRPADMERISTPALANKFIEEQLAALRAQIGSKKVLLALSGGADPHRCFRLGAISGDGYVQIAQVEFQRGEMSAQLRQDRSELRAIQLFADRPLPDAQGYLHRVLHLLQPARHTCPVR